jgi:hypothetical protein
MPLLKKTKKRNKQALPVTQAVFSYVRFIFPIKYSLGNVFSQFISSSVG